MTLPIVPGPFSFLAEAGEAIGDIGQLREQRKERAQQIAEKGSTRLLDMILQGADPSVLDDPNVQKMFKTAGYPVVSSKTARLMGAGERMKGETAQAEIEAGVPKAVATAEAATGKLTSATATAALPLVDLEADAKAAELEAKKTGAMFDAERYKGARLLFGTDPAYRRLAIDAATGVQDLYLRKLAERREELTFERSLLHDRATALKGIGDNADREYRESLERYHKGIIQAIELSGKTADPATVTAWEAQNPFPSQEEFLKKYVKSHTGYSLEEFQQRNREVWNALMPGAAGAAAKPAGAAVEEPKTKVQKSVAAFSEKDVTPENAGESLAFHVTQGDLVEEEAAQIVATMRQQMPAEWFKKFQRQYKAKLKELGPQPIQ